jgi:virginiamycin B lyase
VPTLGSRPHDPEPGPGGTIWWTGMFANVLGRVDPKTNEMKEYHAKTPASGPHGLAFDKAGYLWFTANAKGYIGKLDPKTGDIVEYKLPDDVRDPHTPLIASSDMVFFTAQNANYIGRINPETRKHQGAEDADRTRESLRNGVHIQRYSVRLRLWHEQDHPNRSRNAGY